MPASFAMELGSVRLMNSGSDGRGIETLVLERLRDSGHNVEINHSLDPPPDLVVGDLQVEGLEDLALRSSPPTPLNERLGPD